MPTTQNGTYVEYDGVIWYGPHPCEACGVMIARTAWQQGAIAVDYPDGPVYPNSHWVLHHCRRVALEPPPMPESRDPAPPMEADAPRHKWKVRRHVNPICEEQWLIEIVHPIRRAIHGPEFTEREAKAICDALNSEARPSAGETPT